MFFKNPQKVILILIFLMATGCGLGTPTGGHDPNKPLPVLISDSSSVLVKHGSGAIITTPDGKVFLEIVQTALSADTLFKISPFVPPQGSPRISIDQMYSLEPATVSTLILGQVFLVRLWYDPKLVPSVIHENDLRLGQLDPVNHCWKKVFFDSPSVIPGVTFHQVTSRDFNQLGFNQLGIFGVTTFNTPTCPNSPITF